LLLQLAGLVEPNDMQCYVDDDGNYTHSLVFDYPSISQVSGCNLQLYSTKIKRKNLNFQGDGLWSGHGI
jgi:hypothetical protein